MVKRKPFVLIVCTGNSCRSQMAEGLLKKYASDRFQIESAGMEPKDEVHPHAIQVMSEIGIDISDHVPKSTKKFLGHAVVRYLMIVCDKAGKSCPRIFVGSPHLERLYWPFDDPADATGTDAQRLEMFRRVRNEINERIQAWLKIEIATRGE